MTGYYWARLIVTGLYVIALVSAVLWSTDGRGEPFPFAALAFTASYGVLMLLLWLHQRFPPPK
jgi:hypothetical protein